MFVQSCDTSHSNELPADFAQFTPSTCSSTFESTQYHCCLSPSDTTCTALSKAWSHLFSRTFPFLFDCPFSKLQATSAQSLNAEHRGQSYRRRLRTKSYKNSRGKDCASPRRANGKGAINARTVKSMPLSDSLSYLPKPTSSRWTWQKHRLQMCCQALHPSNKLVGEEGQWGRGQENTAKSMRKIKHDQGNKEQRIPIVQHDFCRELWNFCLVWANLYL